MTADPQYGSPENEAARQEGRGEAPHPRSFSYTPDGAIVLARSEGGRFFGNETCVRGHMDLLPDSIVLPHPSPRNSIWLKKHPWFESRVLPALKTQVAAAPG